MGLVTGGAGGCGGWAGAAGRAGATWIWGAHDGMSTTAGHWVASSCAAVCAGAISGAHAGTPVLARSGTGSAAGSLGDTSAAAAAAAAAAARAPAESSASVGEAAGGTVFVAAAGSGDGAGGTVFADAAIAGGAVAGGAVAGGTVAGGTVAGGTVAGGTVLAAGDPELLAEDGAGTGATGTGFHSDGVGPAGRSGSLESASPKADGGQAGIVCSVGGSGGQMSLCVGIAVSGCAFGGQVRGADRSGGAVGLGSGSPAASPGAGTV